MTCLACDSDSVVRNGFNLFQFTLNCSPVFGSKINTTPLGRRFAQWRVRTNESWASPLRCEAMSCRVELFLQGQNSFCICIGHERTWSYSLLFLCFHRLHFVSPPTPKFAASLVHWLCLNQNFIVWWPIKHGVLIPLASGRPSQIPLDMET